MDAFGGLVTLEFQNADRALKFVNSLNLIGAACCFGGVQSLATHPITMTHSTIPDDILASNGLSPAIVRLSIGLEDAGDY